MQLFAALFAVFALANYVALVAEWVILITDFSVNRLGLISIHTLVGAVLLWTMFQLLEHTHKDFR